MQRLATHGDPGRALFDLFEVWYNRQRPHTSHASVSPARYEALRPERKFGVHQVG